MLENILVVKLGGGEGLDMPSACADLAEIARQRPLVIVHGASAVMNALCEERNIPVETLTSPGGHSSRYTTPQVRDVFVDAARQVNAQVVAELRSHGLDAVGLFDPIVIRGERKSAVRAVVNGRTRVIRDDFSGTITDVDLNPLLQTLEAGQVAVLPPLATSEDGFLNIDGDRAGAAVAGALNAEELIILSNVRGLFRHLSDENSLISQVNRQQLEQAMNWAQGRMKRKVLGAQEALQGGVARVVISDGRITQPVTQALHGEGTVFTR